MRYKIFWIDATTGSCKKMFPRFRIIKNDGEWKDVEVWDYIKANTISELKRKVKKYIENFHREINVFSVIRDKHILFTEENI